ncbi:uncharacterized protein TNCV_3933791 [Trichonephila clavipes]|nr:uncharacterized protein TNCV_3933791 [Trichonephila clavipes]
MGSKPEDCLLAGSSRTQYYIDNIRTGSCSAWNSALFWLREHTDDDVSYKDRSNSSFHNTYMRFPLTISLHKTLNSCRGVISEPDLLTAPDGEILDGFSDQGVIQPYFTQNYKSWIYLNCKIRPYIPNPLRCFKCQRFGHSQTACRGQLTCSRCASVGHASSDSTPEQKCVNCSQPYSADSKPCPKWKIEKEIHTIKTDKNISYIEARKFITPQPSQTYAQVAKSIAVNSSSQTDETITKIVCPPLKLLQPLITISKPNMSSSVPAVAKSSTSTQAQLVQSTSSVTVTSPSVSQPPNSVKILFPPLLIIYRSLPHLPHPHHSLFLKRPPLHPIPYPLHPRIQLQPQNPVGKNVLLKTNQTL